MTCFRDIVNHWFQRVLEARAKGAANSYWDGHTLIRRPRNAYPNLKNRQAETVWALLEKREREIAKNVVKKEQATTSHQPLEQSRNVAASNGKKRVRDSEDEPKSDGSNKRPKVLERLQTFIDEKKASASRQQPRQSQGPARGPNGKKRERDEGQDPERNTPSKRMRPDAHYKPMLAQAQQPPSQPSAPSRQAATASNPTAPRKPGATEAIAKTGLLRNTGGGVHVLKGKDVPSTNTHDPISTIKGHIEPQTTAKDASSKTPLERKAEAETDAETLAKREKVDQPAKASLNKSAPYVTSTRTYIPKNASPKRKTEEEAESPKKKLKTGPVAKSWLFTGKLEKHEAHKERVPGDGRVPTGATANNSKAGKIQSNEQVKRPDTLETEELEETKVAEDEATPDERVTVEEIIPSDTGRRPASFINKGTICFANSVIQTLDSVPEVRNALMAQVKATTDAAFDSFPVAQDFETNDKKAEKEWHGKVEQMLKEEHKTSVKRSCLIYRIAVDANSNSFGHYLGHTFRHMQAAAQKGETVCLYGLMKCFSSRYPGYEGWTIQQEAFDFLDKVIERLEEERACSTEENKIVTPSMKNMFGGQKFTRVCMAQTPRRVAIQADDIRLM
ncbi:MAG: hypothetical protein Q9166_006475 [cf. Caloplaca sp. 2 TL-2023]